MIVPGLSSWLALTRGTGAAPAAGRGRDGRGGPSSNSISGMVPSWARGGGGSGRETGTGGAAEARGGGGGCGREGGEVGGRDTGATPPRSGGGAGRRGGGGGCPGTEAKVYAQGKGADKCRALPRQVRAEAV